MFMYVRKKLLLLFYVLFTISSYALQFGNGNKKSETTFVHVRNNVSNIRFDNYTTFIIDTNNVLWGTGLNPCKLIGMQGPALTDDYVKLYEGITHFEGNILKFSNGKTYYVNNGLYSIPFDYIKISHNLWLKKDKTLWLKDSNLIQNYKLLRNDVIDFYSNGFYTLILTDKNELYITGEYKIPGVENAKQGFVKLAEDVKKITEGFYINNSDELYAFGYNGTGALGINSDQVYVSKTLIMNNVKNVESNQQVTLILRNDNSLYGCGGKTPNYCGELGFGNKKPILVPEFIMTDVKEISVGFYVTAVIKVDNSLWMCGANDFMGLM